MPRRDSLTNYIAFAKKKNYTSIDDGILFKFHTRNVWIMNRNGWRWIEWHSILKNPCIDSSKFHQLLNQLKLLHKTVQSFSKLVNVYLSQQAHQHQITHESPYGNATDVTQKIGYAKKKSVVDLKKAILYNEPEETVMQNRLQPITSIIGRSERATDYFIYKGYILIKRIRLNTGKPEFNCRRTHNGKTRCNITTSGRHNASSDTYILRLPASSRFFSRNPNWSLG